MTVERVNFSRGLVVEDIADPRKEIIEAISNDEGVVSRLLPNQLIDVTPIVLKMHPEYESKIWLNTKDDGTAMLFVVPEIYHESLVEQFSQSDFANINGVSSTSIDEHSQTTALWATDLDENDVEQII